MASISLIYPSSGLSITVSVVNKTTNLVNFTWLATEVADTGVYEYVFTEAADTDYAYIAVTPWYSILRWMIYRDSASSGWGGLTPTQASQLASTVKKGDTLLNLWDVILPI